MIKQLTVFLENTEGRLAALTRAISDAGINMNMLTIAEVSDYGLVRILCEDASLAAEKLETAGFRAKTTDVLAVEVPNVPGGLAKLLETLDVADVNIEYGYCFNISDERAVDVFKVTDDEQALSALTAAGFTALNQEDLF